MSEQARWERPTPTTAFRAGSGDRFHWHPIGRPESSSRPLGRERDRQSIGAAYESFGEQGLMTVLIDRRTCRGRTDSNSPAPLTTLS